MTLELCAWPEQQLGDALLLLARRVGLAADQARAPRAHQWVFARGKDARNRNQRVRIGEWISDAALYLGFDAQPVSAAFAELPALLARCAPALLHVSGASSRFLAIVARSGSSLQVLTPQGELRRVLVRDVLAAIAAPLAVQLEGDIDGTLSAARFSGERRVRAQRALSFELLGSTEIGRCYLLRERTRGLGWRTFGEPSLATELCLHLLAHALGLAASVGGFALLGTQALWSKSDPGPLWLAALLLACSVPLRTLAEWHAGRAAIGLARRLREQLLLGIFQLTPEELRGDGSGAHLARVMEAESFQTLALNGALAAVGALLELLASLVLIASSPATNLLGWFAAFYLGLGAWSIARLYRTRSAWAQARLALAAHNTERMLGYATRLAQEPMARWHEEEDAELSTYLDASRRADAARNWLRVVQGRGWLLLGILALVPVQLQGASPAALAVGVGALLLGQRAVGQLGAAAAALVDALIAWRAVGPIYRAAGRSRAVAPPELTSPHAGEDAERRAEIIEARDVCFSYSPQAPPVIANAALAIRTGDQLLIEGPSGGGKSTFAALLAGARLPSSGLLLARGLDLRTLGVRGWRPRVVAAPQYHENHIFSAPLAFNLLMGRRWPAEDDDLQDAAELCDALGLGNLVQRMPAGLRTPVGETGWQLSHGERSRVFLARALLQGAEITLLDESFAALDPETLERCMRAVRQRCQTLVVVAHPSRCRTQTRALAAE